MEAYMRVEGAEGMANADASPSSSQKIYGELLSLLVKHFTTRKSHFPSKN